jgi:type I restriction enzyme, S subunit
LTTETLNGVCEFVVDCLHSTAPTETDGYPLIRTPNIGKGRLDFDGVYRVSQETYEIWTKRAVPEEGDLILAREAPAGNVAIVKNGERVCLGQRTVHLRPDRSKVDPDFLCYYLLAPPQQAALLAGETGVTAGHVNMKDIRALRLVLPPRPNQERIGRILSAYDDLIENNRRRIVLLEDAARQVYREWFVRLQFPGHEHTRLVDCVPEGWETQRIDQFLTLNYGKALKAEDRADGLIPVFGSSGVVGHHSASICRGPGIIVGRKGNVGSVYWSHEPFWAIDTVYFTLPEHSDLYLYYALANTSFVNTDGAVPGLNREFAYSRRMILPDARIRRWFVELVEPMHCQIALLNQAIVKLRAARDLLLPRLMSGEIAV